MEGIDMSFLHALSAALGLDSDHSTEEQVVEKVRAMAEAAGSPSLDQFVPRADYALALERAATAEGNLSEHQAAALDRVVAAEITTALEAGKITPATAAYHRTQCQSEGGLERFRAFAAAAPVVAAASQVKGQPESLRRSLTSEEQAVSSVFGHSAEDLDKYAPPPGTQLGIAVCIIICILAYWIPAHAGEPPPRPCLPSN